MVTISDPRIDLLWAKQTAAFDSALALLPIPGKRVTIKGAGFDIPAIWYMASNSKERRPTIIVGGGYDGGQEEVYHQMGIGALSRGWNFLTYEGPGQASPRRYQNLGVHSRVGKSRHTSSGLPPHSRIRRHFSHRSHQTIICWSFSSSSCGIGTQIEGCDLSRWTIRIWRLSPARNPRGSKHALRLWQQHSLQHHNYNLSLVPYRLDTVLVVCPARDVGFRYHVPLRFG